MTLGKKKKAILTAAVFAGLIFMVGGNTMAHAATPVTELAQASQMKRSTITPLTNDSRVFKLDKDIETAKVTFDNRYGYTVAGHLYLPKNFDAHKQYPAVVISGPFGAVKEQVSGLYAQELAKQGFVTVAFDPSMTGESSGTRRNMGSPDIFYRRL